MVATKFMNVGVLAFIFLLWLGQDKKPRNLERKRSTESSRRQAVGIRVSPGGEPTNEPRSSSLWLLAIYTSVRQWCSHLQRISKGL